MKSYLKTRNAYSQREPYDFSKIKVGNKTLSDALVEIKDTRYRENRIWDKHRVLNAIRTGNLHELREISDFFYRTSGIYSRLCRYMAYMYKYDWYITPYLKNNKADNKALEAFDKALCYLDNSDLKKFFGEVALKVVRKGCFYGYRSNLTDRAVVQELPAKYCRTALIVGDFPAVEFNMQFFDEMFPVPEAKQKILELFPKDFKKGYQLYKEGKLPADLHNKRSGWYMLDPAFAIKFNLNGEDIPPFISVIPAIIDLEDAKDLDKEKMEQRLMKIIIQQLPLNKDGEIIFDPDEAQALHHNAVQMLAKAIGVKVLTTFADVEVEDLDNDTNSTSDDDLTRVERSLYNEAGVSQLQFNSDNSVSLEKSILNDEASMLNLIEQFQSYLNSLLDQFKSSAKKFYFRGTILHTTIYNYKELAKLFKEQTQLGYSKMLPQIALGLSQSSVLATVHFENDVLNLAEILIPPMQSSTMNADAINKIKSGGSASSSDKEGAGRPTNEESGKVTTEKTVANRESAG